MAVSANRLELLQIADAVAREKNIDRMIVIESMQDAIEMCRSAGISQLPILDGDAESAGTRAREHVLNAANRLAGAFIAHRQETGRSLAS